MQNLGEAIFQTDNWEWETTSG